MAASNGINRPEQRDKPYLILVSFDGFRPDYLDRFALPNFQRVSCSGCAGTKNRAGFPLSDRFRIITRW